MEVWLREAFKFVVTYDVVCCTGESCALLFAPQKCAVLPNSLQHY